MTDTYDLWWIEDPALGLEIMVERYTLDEKTAIASRKVQYPDFYRKQGIG